MYILHIPYNSYLADISNLLWLVIKTKFKISSMLDLNVNVVLFAELD